MTYLTAAVLVMMPIKNFVDKSKGWNKFFYVFGIAMIGCLLIVRPCLSQTVSGTKWRAISDTSISITGNVIFFKDHILFQNGKSIRISFLGRVHGFITETEKPRDADLYQVITKKNLILLNTNTLCGRNIVTYIAIWDADKVSRNDIYPKGVYIYTGKNKPVSEKDSSYCGGFGYDAG